MPAAKKRKGMTFDQFLHKLRKLQGKFHIGSGLFPSELRDEGGACPVSAVANLVQYNGARIWGTHVNAPAAALGLPKKTAWRIARSADHPVKMLSPLQRNYRNRMLRALKLREV